MPISSLELSEATTMLLDRYIREKVILVVSQQIDKSEWSDEPLLILKSYQNQMRQDIKDLWIHLDRHAKRLSEIEKKLILKDLTSLELSADPMTILEEQIKRLEARMPNDDDIDRFEERIRRLESKLQNTEEN